MRTTKTILIITSFIASIEFSSCIGKLVEGETKKNSTIEKGKIPPEFGKDNSTLLIVHFENKRMLETMEDVVAEEYHGKYEFVTDEEYKSEKYKDTDKYRYAFYITKISYATGSSSQVSLSYDMYDRKENGKVYAIGSSSFYSIFMRAYFGNLEKVRIENQKP